MFVIKILLSIILISIVLIFTFADKPSNIHESGEKKCNELVAIEEDAWIKLLDRASNVGLDNSIPEIRDWNEKQKNARENCIGPNHYRYSGITILNKRINDFGNAGGFKINY